MPITITAEDRFQDLLDGADRVALELSSTGAVNFYVGTAEGAIEEALGWTGANAAPREVGDWALNHRGPGFSLYR